jgi:hypothetical protein
MFVNAKTGREDPPTDEPIWIVCRRAEDFGTGQIPDGALTDNCTRCMTTLVYNPNGPTFSNNPPRVCMQCAGIEPLSIP